MSGSEELPQSLLNLAVAFLLGIPIGWERERHPDIGPGLRTFPLVALGACAYLEVGKFAFADSPEGQSRVFQALVSGIGFIGAGAIIKGRAEVHGLATAVSLWVTVSVGTAAAYGLYLLAAVLAASTLAGLLFLKPFKRRPERADEGANPERRG